MRLEPAGWYSGRKPDFYVVSAGPDRKFGDDDDMRVAIEARNVTVFGASGRATIDLRIEHDRGAFNGLAEVTGSVLDLSGAVIPGATVSLRSRDGARIRTATTNGRGFYTFSAVPAGRYEIKIGSPGFERASRDLEVQPRDLAILKSVLAVGSVMEAVTVQNAMLPMDVVALPDNGRAGAGVMLDGVAAAPMGAMMFGRGAGIGLAKASSMALRQTQTAALEAHVRSYFPEALYINPEILTDDHGDASISIPLADSITTWRMAMFASTKTGALGSASSGLKVFQDFFADLDLPVTITQGDRISIPVAVYNYAGQRGDVSLKLQREDWFSLVDNAAEKTVRVDSGQVGGSQFTIEARHIGKFKLTLSARMAGLSKRQDVVVREIEVVPNGRQQEIVFNGRLDGSVRHTVSFSADAIPEASKVFVRLYPGPLSQIIEGMDGILRMPGGCFEQTSSSTYPNVLALDYMKRTKKDTPEVHAKAEDYIAKGYQRLLTFEVPGGGFRGSARRRRTKF